MSFSSTGLRPNVDNLTLKVTELLFKCRELSSGVLTKAIVELVAAIWNLCLHEEVKVEQNSVQLSDYGKVICT